MAPRSARTASTRALRRVISDSAAGSRLVGVGLRVGLDRDRHALFPGQRRHALPQLLGDKRDERVRQAEDRFEHAHQSPSRRALPCRVAVGELDLGEFDVPVAILVPHELVYHPGRQVEAIPFQVRRNLRFGFLQPADDPPVGERQLHLLTLVESDVLAGDVHQHEACGVPQLVAEVAIALAALEVEIQRAARGCQAGKREAHGVRTERGDALRELLARALLDRLALLLQHQARGLLGNQGLRGRCHRSDRAGRGYCPWTSTSSARPRRARGH